MKKIILALVAAATMSAPVIQAETTMVQDLATLTREILHGKAAPEKWQGRYEEELKKIKLIGTILRAQGVDPKDIMALVDNLIIKAQDGATCDQLLAELHKDVKNNHAHAKALKVIVNIGIIMIILAIIIAAHIAVAILAVMLVAAWIQEFSSDDNDNSTYNINFIVNNNQSLSKEIVKTMNGGQTEYEALEQAIKNSKQDKDVNGTVIYKKHFYPNLNDINNSNQDANNNRVEENFNTPNMSINVIYPELQDNEEKNSNN